VPALSGVTPSKAGFVELFKADPQSKLTVRLKHFRFIKPEILSIEGESVITSPKEEPNENVFSAILVKVGEKWQIEQASESPIPTPATPYDGLKGLEWMVGNWVDEHKGVAVECQLSWNEKKTLLIRKYSVQYDNDPECENGYTDHCLGSSFQVDPLVDVQLRRLFRRRDLVETTTMNGA